MTTWTVGKVLTWATDDFKQRAIPSPRLDAEVLLAWVLSCPRIALYTEFDRPLHRNELDQFKQTISKRRQGEPVAYIVGRREFWSLEFEVTPDVLIPRPETETLVEAALARVSKGPVLDLCTGSGCVGIALAHERPTVEVDATDISAAACVVARRNAEKNGVADRVRVCEGDLFQALAEPRLYEVIVSNPPYVRSGELTTLQPEVRREPSRALDGGATGLDLIDRLLAGADRYLAPGGWLALEVDPRQIEALSVKGQSIFGQEPVIVRDLAGAERVILWQWPLG